MEIALDLQKEWDIGAQGMDSILQGLQVIFLTIAYSVPLDRSFAHDGKIIDSPMPKTTMLLAGKLIAAIEKYEPRIKVDKITFTETTATDYLAGKMIPHIFFHLAEGVQL